MTKIPWFSHLTLFFTDIAFTHVVGGSVGIAFGALAIDSSAIIADPVWVALP